MKENPKTMNIFLEKLLLLRNYLLSTFKLTTSERFTVNLMSDDETIKALRDKGYSLARFGDGEFRWMRTNIDICAFQKPSTELSQALNGALYSNKKNLLIGLPLPLFDDKHCSFEAAAFWRQYAVENRTWLKQTIPNRKYCNASITRPYMDFKDKSTASKRFEALKSIWQNRSVLIVEGSQTKFGVNNDLLQNATQVRRIIAPSENAFSSYDEIKRILNLVHKKNELVLACLGPTATILAADQDLDSLQIIDIGHLDIEYEWYLMRATKKTAVKGKYVNEANSSGDNSLEQNTIYQNSIIAKIAH